MPLCITVSRKLVAEFLFDGAHEIGERRIPQPGVGVLLIPSFDKSGMFRQQSFVRALRAVDQHGVRLIAGFGKGLKKDRQGIAYRLQSRRTTEEACRLLVMARMPGKHLPGIRPSPVEGRFLMPSATNRMGRKRVVGSSHPVFHPGSRKQRGIGAGIGRNTGDTCQLEGQSVAAREFLGEIQGTEQSLKRSITRKKIRVLCGKAQPPFPDSFQRFLLPRRVTGQQVLLQVPRPIECVSKIGMLLHQLQSLVDHAGLAFCHPGRVVCIAHVQMIVGSDIHHPFSLRAKSKTEVPRGTVDVDPQPRLSFSRPLRDLDFHSPFAEIGLGRESLPDSPPVQDQGDEPLPCFSMQPHDDLNDFF